MKIKKRSNKKIQIILSILAILFIAIACIVYVRYLNPTTDPITQTQPSQKNPEQKQQEPVDTQQGTAMPIDTSVIPETQKNISPAYEGTDTNQSPSLTGSITYSSVSGSNLVIRTAIDQALGSGTCRLTLTNGARVVTRTSNIAPNPSSSTCEGFDIAIAELSGGKWNISIEISSGSKTGVLTGSVDV